MSEKDFPFSPQLTNVSYHALHLTTQQCFPISAIIVMYTIIYQPDCMNKREYLEAQDHMRIGAVPKLVKTGSESGITRQSADRHSARHHLT